MMELEHSKLSTSTLTAIPTSSIVSDSDMVSYRITGNQLTEILSSRYSSPCVILDCRESGSLLTVRGAQKVRLPSVLYRRLVNGSLLPTSISPLLVNASDCQVVIVRDSLAPNSLASKVFNMLVQRQFNVAFLADEIDELARLHPSLVTSPEDIVSELKLNLLSVCDGYKANSSNQISKEKNQPPSKLFPVQILPYLYLGNDETAKDKVQLEKYGIRYIINVTSNLPNYFEHENNPHFRYLRISVDDTSGHNLAQFFPDAIDFIEKAHAENSNVLVHCWAGISRSVTVCLAYLMHATHKTLEEAFDILLKQNGAIAPNFHFMGQLTEFERTLFSNDSLFTPDSGLGSSVPSSTTSSESGCSSY